MEEVLSIAKDNQRECTDTCRCISTETVCRVNVYTIDKLAHQEMRGRPDRHFVCNLNNLWRRYNRPGCILNGGIEFQEIILDYCWMLNNYYTFERISTPRRCLCCWGGCGEF